MGGQEYYVVVVVVVVAVAWHESNPLTSFYFWFNLVFNNLFHLGSCVLVNVFTLAVLWG